MTQLTLQTLRDAYHLLQQNEPPAAEQFVGSLTEMSAFCRCRNREEATPHIQSALASLDISSQAIKRHAQSASPLSNEFDCSGDTEKLKALLRKIMPIVKENLQNADLIQSQLQQATTEPSAVDSPVSVQPIRSPQPEAPTQMSDTDFLQGFYGFYELVMTRPRYTVSPIASILSQITPNLTMVVRSFTEKTIPQEIAIPRLNALKTAVEKNEEPLKAHCGDAQETSRFITLIKTLPPQETYTRLKNLLAARLEDEGFTTDHLNDLLRNETAKIASKMTPDLNKNHLLQAAVVAQAFLEQLRNHGNNAQITGTPGSLSAADWTSLSGIGENDSFFNPFNEYDLDTIQESARPKIRARAMEFVRNFYESHQLMDRCYGTKRPSGIEISKGLEKFQLAQVTLSFILLYELSKLTHLDADQIAAQQPRLVKQIVLFALNHDIVKTSAQYSFLKAFCDQIYPGALDEDVAQARQAWGERRPPLATLKAGILKALQTDAMTPEEYDLLEDHYDLDDDILNAWQAWYEKMEAKGTASGAPQDEQKN